VPPHRLRQSSVLQARSLVLSGDCCAMAPVTRIGRMRLKVAFLASVAAGVLAACGGADNGSAGVSVSNNSSSAGTSSPAPQPSVSSSNTRTCQALSGPATIVGGDLLVAEQG